MGGFVIEKENRGGHQRQQLGVWRFLAVFLALCFFSCGYRQSKAVFCTLYLNSSVGVQAALGLGWYAFTFVYYGPPPPPPAVSYSLSFVRGEDPQAEPRCCGALPPQQQQVAASIWHLATLRHVCRVTKLFRSSQRLFFTLFFRRDITPTHSLSGRVV